MRHQCECGHSWRTGEHGGHTCSDNYQETIQKLNTRLATVVHAVDLYRRVGTTGARHHMFAVADTCSTRYAPQANKETLS